MTNNEMILSLKSDTFAAMKEDFDGVLARTIGNMEMKNADNATITLKLGITLDKVSVGTPNGNQDITRPSFNMTSALSCRSRTASPALLLETMSSSTRMESTSCVVSMTVRPTCLAAMLNT